MGIRTGEVMIVNGLLRQEGVSFRSYRDYRRSAVFACVCGKKKIISITCVKSGEVKNCGCSRKRRISLRATHGGASRSHLKMIDRVTNKNHPAYEIYKWKTICPEWYRFKNFLNDMGDRPEGMTLDRIDNALGYFKGNCRWATMKQQNLNKTNCVVIEHNGISKTVTEWADDLGVKRKTIYERLRIGWSPEKAITEPVQKRTLKKASNVRLQ